MQRALGAQMSHALKGQNVAVIFGIPGGHNMDLYRGLEEVGHLTRSGPARTGDWVYGG